MQGVPCIPWWRFVTRICEAFMTYLQYLNYHPSHICATDMKSEPAFAHIWSLSCIDTAICLSVYWTMPAHVCCQAHQHGICTACSAIHKSQLCLQMTTWSDWNMCDHCGNHIVAAWCLGCQRVVLWFVEGEVTSLLQYVWMTYQVVLLWLGRYYVAYYVVYDW